MLPDFRQMVICILETVVRITRIQLDTTQLKQVVLYADVSGSTRIYEKYGDRIARADIGSCLDLLSDVVHDYDGRVVKTIGDEVMCLFKNPLKAAMAAMDMQDSLRTAGEGGRFQTGILHIKIGWHYGEIQWRGREPVGEGTVIAQHVIHMAKADEILTTLQSINSLPEEMQGRAHRIDHIVSEMSGDEIDVCIFQWEESDDVTQAAATGRVEDNDIAMVLESSSATFRMDAEHPECILGRGQNCNLIINGRYVSRLHAAIQLRHGNFHIQDNSSNGSVILFSDGRMVRIHREEYMLTGSGRICLGSTPDEDPGATIAFHIK